MRCSDYSREVWVVKGDFYVRQQEEQSLVSVLGENIDKMQLTRRILDLKQVSAAKEQENNS